MPVLAKLAKSPPSQQDLKAPSRRPLNSFRRSRELQPHFQDRVKIQVVKDEEEPAQVQCRGAELRGRNWQQLRR